MPARVKAGLGGQEVALCLYCFGSGKGAVGVSPQNSSHWGPLCPGSFPDPVQLQGSGSWDHNWGGGGGGCCAISPAGWRSSGIHIAHRPLLTSTSSHGNIDPKQDSTFFTFFLKCKKLSAALERRSLDRPFYAKEKGAADGGSTRAVVWGTRTLLPPVPPYMHSLSHTQRHTHSPHSCRQMASDWLLSSPKG